ncbi:anthranilate synthase family protein [Kutzneria sp. NPDC051319]|uniref:anthranilate synthase family protein n=1 Tax=Kutzneria sp. NPDC051319 TaxID=3155047 RepID=UPI00342762D3
MISTLGRILSENGLAPIAYTGGEGFALLHRPGRHPDVDLLAGPAIEVDTLAELPLDRGEVLAAIPYRQIAERGFACHDDGTPLAAIIPTRRHRLPVADLVRATSGLPVTVAEGRFDIDDDQYAALVRKIIDNEIGQGRGANFVIRRAFRTTVDDWSVDTALALFARLLRQERGAYWTFLVHTGTRVLIGASPESHLTLSDGVATMNPISGTYRYPPGGATTAGLLEFMGDRKESDELYMVLDEELKMMSRICRDVRVVGPALRQMANLAHTEYFIEGRTERDVRDLLAETLFAPTVTGSPLQSATEVIARYEPGGRGYYSGALALAGRDESGRPTLDSAILIRTADISLDGGVRIDVGATLVRHSDPRSEVAETHAKAAGLLAALHADRRPPMAPAVSDTAGSAGQAPGVRDALAARNDGLSRFWLGGRPPVRAAGRGARTVILDCEDTFTSMLAAQLASLGLVVEVRGIHDQGSLADADLVVLGPGPGDPRDARDPKIRRMAEVVGEVLDHGTPLLAICLGHQVLAVELGLEVVRRTVPNQGARRWIDLFGRRRQVGFYNTFAARGRLDDRVAVSRDPATGEIHALRSDRYCSVQFHPESVLTEHGTDILGELIESLLSPVAAGVPGKNYSPE